jgi:hypothetical protein
MHVIIKIIDINNPTLSETPLLINSPIGNKIIRKREILSK